MSDRRERLWAACKKLPQDYAPYGELDRETAKDGDFGPDCSWGCKHFVELHVDKGDYEGMPMYSGHDVDWGVCTNCKSHRCGLLTWEHQGCIHFEDGLCEACDGCGWVLEPERLRGVVAFLRPTKVKCPECNGTGKLKEDYTDDRAT